MLADRVGIIDHGHIVAEGTPEALKAEIGRPTRRGDPRDRADRDGSSPRSRRPASRSAGAGGRRPAARRRRTSPRRPRPRRRGPPHRQPELQPPSLDDVFLAKTGRSLEGAGDEAGAASRGRVDAPREPLRSTDLRARAALGRPHERQPAARRSSR